MGANLSEYIYHMSIRVCRMGRTLNLIMCVDRQATTMATKQRMNFSMMSHTRYQGALPAAILSPTPGVLAGVLVNSTVYLLGEFSFLLLILTVFCRCSVALSVLSAVGSTLGQAEA
eukprot:6578372-Pyramimonas_sp.AAC.1